MFGVVRYVDLLGQMCGCGERDDVTGGLLKDRCLAGFRGLCGGPDGFVKGKMFYTLLSKWRRSVALAIFIMTIKWPATCWILHKRRWSANFP